MTGGKRDSLHSQAHSPRWSQQPGLGQAEGGSRSFHVRFPHGWQRSKCFKRCVLRHVCRELDPKLNSPGTQIGTPTWDAGIGSTGLAHSATVRTQQTADFKHVEFSVCQACSIKWLRGTCFFPYTHTQAEQTRGINIQLKKCIRIKIKS